MIPDTALGAMETRLAELIAERRMITREAEKRGRRTLDDVQTLDFRRLSADIADLREAIEGAKEDRDRRADSHNAADRIFNASQSKNGNTMTTTQYRNESRVYNETTAREGRSFWRDLVLHKTGDDATGEARARLNEHTAEQRTGLTTTGDGSSFVPPIYLEELWIQAAVAAKPFIASIPEYPAPKGHTINVPKITAPGTVGVQNPELSAATNTDQTDEFLSTQLTTIVGQQLVSRQTLDMSPIDIDSIIFKGLSQSWASEQDQIALYGTGSSGQYTGIANLSGITQFQSSGNTIAEIYSDLTKAIKLHWANRFLAPTTVMVHPNTAAEWLNKLDTTNRPLFVPSQQGPFNAAGIIDSLNAQGPIGKILGLDLVLDPNITTTGGVESVFVFRADDLMFFTSGMRAQVHFDRYADELGVLLSLWSYDGLIARYPSSIIEITGFPFGS
jgi:HK97 family phage major capsid protein